MTKEGAIFDHDADERKLDEMFDGFLEALEAKRSDLVSSRWRALERGLAAHMDKEEQLVIPSLSTIRLQDALAILGEHRDLRARLGGIGEAIARGGVRLENARQLRVDLHTHTGREEAILRLARSTGAP